MLPYSKLPEYGADGELLLEKFCLICGNANSLDAVYCTVCNASFSEQPRQPAIHTSPDLRISQISWFPYRKFSILIPVSVEDAASRLAQVTLAWRWYWWFTKVGQFEGYVSTEDFRLLRRVIYPNLFVPILHGSFKRMRSRTRITVELALNRRVYFLLVLGCLFTAIGTLDSIFYQRVIGTFIIPGIPFLVGYLIALVTFNFETRKAIVFMEDVFRTRKTKP